MPDEWKTNITKSVNSLKDTLSSMPTLESIRQILNENNHKLKQELVSEITTLVSENLSKDLSAAHEDLENRLNDRIGEEVEAINVKLSNLEASSNSPNVAAKLMLKETFAAIDAVNLYDCGIFIPNVFEQFKQINSSLFQQKFRGKVDSLPSFKAVNYALDYIYTILSDANIPVRILVDNAHVQSATVFGKGSTKNLSVQFVSKSSAEIIREALITFNKYQTAEKKTTFRFLRMKTKFKNLDENLAIGAAVLYAAKTSNLIAAYHQAPRLDSDKNIILTTRVRYHGDTKWCPLAWSCQSLDQASSDLISLLTTSSEPELAQFQEKLAKLKERFPQKSPTPSKQATPKLRTPTPPTSTSVENLSSPSAPQQQRTSRRTTTNKKFTLQSKSFQ